MNLLSTLLTILKTTVIFIIVIMWIAIVIKAILQTQKFVLMRDLNGPQIILLNIIGLLISASFGYLVGNLIISICDL